VTGAESFLQYAYICILKPYFSSVIGPVVYVLDLADRLISKACPFAAAGIMVGSIYWTAVTYGAVTVMQVHIYSPFLDLISKCSVFPFKIISHSTQRSKSQPVL